MGRFQANQDMTRGPGYRRHNRGLLMKKLCSLGALRINRAMNNEKNPVVCGHDYAREGALSVLLTRARETGGYPCSELLLFGAFWEERTDYNAREADSDPPGAPLGGPPNDPYRL